jgi:hypothetical protein
VGRTTTQSLDSEHPKRFNSRLGKLIIATNFDAHDSELDLSGRFDRGHKIDGEGGICGIDTIDYRLYMRSMIWPTYRPVYGTILDVLTLNRWSIVKD